MINVAFVDFLGQIAQWASPGDDNQWPDRTMVDKYFIVHLPHDTDMVEFSKTNIWNYSTETWLSRPPRPNIYYEWDGSQWYLDSEKLYEAIRQQRNAKLYACDWTQLSDAPLSEELKISWSVYRQELRDIPNTQTDITSPEQIQWPTPPA
jgi:hypothetical protein